MSYTAEICVGNPPQKLRALFDTGSANTWIINKNLDIGASKPTFSYDDKASSTNHKTA